MRCTLFLVAVLALSLSGCSGDKGKDSPEKKTTEKDTALLDKVKDAEERANRENDLKFVGLAVHNYFSAHNDRGPGKAEDLKPYMGGVERPTARLLSGDIVVLYGIGIQDMVGTPEGLPKTVLGYEKDVPTKGGIVLYGEGSVANVTAEEFAKLKLAKKKK